MGLGGGLLGQGLEADLTALAYITAVIGWVRINFEGLKVLTHGGSPVSRRPRRVWRAGVWRAGGAMCAAGGEGGGAASLAEGGVEGV